MNMDGIDRIIEEKIKKAMEEGAFDNLPGKGKPLKLEENPYEDPTWRMASNLLRSNGFTLPWIEIRQEIENELELARRDLRLAWQCHLNAGTEADWQIALNQFHSQIKRLNRSILGYNLQAPRPVFHRSLIDTKHELAELTHQESSD
jgi:DnaJ homolog subfamily C member 28